MSLYYSTDFVAELRVLFVQIAHDIGRTGREKDKYPYPEFGEGKRKNGPGTVALLVGIDELAARIDALSEDAGWSGYLFLSTAAAGGHVITDTARNRFAALAERAEVTVADETPTPKMGLRFWYSLYGDAVRQIAERYTLIADTVGQKYVSILHLRTQ